MLTIIPECWRIIVTRSCIAVIAAHLSFKQMLAAIQTAGLKAASEPSSFSPLLQKAAVFKTDQNKGVTILSSSSSAPNSKLFISSLLVFLSMLFFFVSKYCCTQDKFSSKKDAQGYFLLIHVSMQQQLFPYTFLCKVFSPTAPNPFQVPFHV